MTTTQRTQLNQARPRPQPPRVTIIRVSTQDVFVRPINQRNGNVHANSTVITLKGTTVTF